MVNTVALLVEGVGRNLSAQGDISDPLKVALLVEGVGRNNVTNDEAEALLAVALLVEGVGRNKDYLAKRLIMKVALLVEGVGRNNSRRPHQRTISRRPPRGGRG